MNTDKVLSDIEQLRKVGVEGIRSDSTLFILLNETYKSIYGRSLCCLPEVEGALHTLGNYADKINGETLEKMMNEEKLFLLSPESLLYSVVNDKYYTHATISDEDACVLLKNNPNLIEQFAKYPENWREVVGLDNKSATGETTEQGTAESLVDPQTLTRRKKK